VGPRLFGARRVAVQAWGFARLALRRCVAVELDLAYCHAIVARLEQTLGDEVPSRLYRDDQVLGYLEPQRLGVHGRLEVWERLSASC
jgi:hypothetical protein